VSGADFLMLLRDQLRLGLRALPDAYKRRHLDFLLAQRGEDGGFRNRGGQVELYYTSFAVRALSALKELTPALAQQTGDYLLRGCQRERGGPFKNAVSAASWWDSLTLCEEALGSALKGVQRLEQGALTHARLNQLRRDDGGWAKHGDEAHGSLYHTLLASGCYLRMGKLPPEPEAAVAFLIGLQQPGGGFLENRYSKRPGVNGSAAGVALSLLLNVAIDPLPHAAFFLNQFDPAQGGFLATPQAPMADLLSTFTALFCLNLLGADHAAVLRPSLAFARDLEVPAGGYLGFHLETDPDCEYTFYGLGVEALAAFQAGAGQLEGG
jgi:geranylgeranyl transferase type-2 subunit beta